MFSHVCIGAASLAPMVAFYDAVLAPLGIGRFVLEPGVAGWRTAPGGPAFYVGHPFDGRPPTPGNGCMTAFLALSRAAVDESYAAGLASGGSSEGQPGERPQYGPGYYGAYLRDPEGNKLHIVRRPE